jgi:hypothetical protein
MRAEFKEENYYHAKQILKIRDDMEKGLDYYPTFKFRTQYVETKWLDLHHESAKVLIKFLAERFPAAFNEAKNESKL